MNWHSESDNNRDIDIVNIIYALIVQRQKDIQYREDSIVKLRRLQSENDQLLISQVKYQDKVVSLEKELSSKINKERTLLEMMQDNKIKWDMEKEELIKKCNKIQHKETQYEHQIRKKERQYETLKEKMNNLLIEKNREVKNSILILTQLQKQETNRVQNKKGEGGSTDEMYRMIIDRYEQKLKLLMVENLDLRNSYKEIKLQVQELIDTHKISDLKDINNDNNNNNQELNDSQFDLPFTMIQETIEEHVKAKIKIIRSKLNNLKDNKTTEEDNINNDDNNQYEIGTLVAKLSKYYNTISIS